MYSRLSDILQSTDREVTFRRNKTRRKCMASIYMIWELKVTSKGASSSMIVFVASYVL